MDFENALNCRDQIEINRGADKSVRRSLIPK